MLYGSISGISKPVSRLIQGIISLNTQRRAEGYELLDAVYEHGCNTFDTAHIYGGGECERVLGGWVRERDLREKVVIITKGAHHNADRRRVTPYDIAADLHDSLVRLDMEYVDLYLLHRDDPTAPVGPIVEVLNEYLRAGKIRAFGGSNWSHRRIAEAEDYAHAHGLAPFAVSSPHYSLAEQVDAPWDDCISISGPRHKEARSWYQSKKMPVLAWSSLSGGFFSGRYTPETLNAGDPAQDMCIRCYRSEENIERLNRANEMARDKGVELPQLALAYALNSPMIVFPLVGCANGDEFRVNAEVLDLTLTEQEMAWLDLRD